MQVKDVRRKISITMVKKFQQQTSNLTYFRVLGLIEDKSFVYENISSNYDEKSDL